MFVCLNGTFLDAREAKISVFDHGFMYGDGVYETLRTFRGRVWQMDAHLHRLERSARKLSLNIPYSRKTVQSWVRKLCLKNGYPDSRIRITLTRGQSGFDFSSSQNPILLIQAWPLKPEPESVYKRGVKVITLRCERVLPSVKSISLLPFVLGQQMAEKARASEGIFVDRKGYVREGTMTNVFIVKKGAIITPGENILSGTTRATLLQLARRRKLKVRVAECTVRSLLNADEIFITNAVRGIIPVRQVDNRVIGSPGPVTRMLIQALHEHMEKTCCA